MLISSAASVLLFVAEGVEILHRVVGYVCMYVCMYVQDIGTYIPIAYVHTHLCVPTFSLQCLSEQVKIT